MTISIIDRIDRLVEQRSLLTHPFYQAWTVGNLPVDSLKKYAAQYYHFEKAYPTFLSGIHHRTSNQSVRQLLLDNLWDEEHGEENHVELWLRFCDALGLSRDEVRDGKVNESTMDLVGTYEGLTFDEPPAAGAAALYAYESQVPQVASVKIDGLRRFYGMDNERDISFFKVHQAMDVQHSEAERDMVTTLASTESDADVALMAADRATDALWQFLDGVY